MILIQATSYVCLLTVRVQGKSTGLASVVSHALDTELRRKIQALQQQVCQCASVPLKFLYGNEDRSCKTKRKSCSCPSRTPTPPEQTRRSGRRLPKMLTAKSRAWMPL